MIFGEPKFLYFIPFILFFFYVSHFFVKRNKLKLEAWINPKLWLTVIPDYSSKIYLKKTILLMIASVFILLAMARPQWGEKEEVIQTVGMDVFFLVDLSSSMLAEDVTPSRLSRVQTMIKKITQNLSGDRIGVIGFAGSAQLSIPLTTDFQYINEIIDTLDPSQIPNQGTKISEALDAAMSALSRSGENPDKTSRAVILITDGEDFGNDAPAAAKKLKDFGTLFFAISVGTTEGAPIPIRDDSGVLQTYKKDERGKPILTRVNKENLQKIANEADGKILELINPDDTAYTLTKQLQQLHRGKIKDQRVTTKIDRFHYFLIPALFLFFVFLMLGHRKAKYSVWLLFCFLQNYSYAVDTHSLKSFIENKNGSQYFENKVFEESTKSFQSAHKNDPTNPALLFNEGTSLSQENKIEEAIPKFKSATQQALAQGDYDLAAQSLYNEGVAHSESKNLNEAYDRLAKSAESAKIAKNPELERKAREALASIAIKQKQKKEQEKQDQNKNEEKKEDKKENQKDNKQEEKQGDDQKDKSGDQKSESDNKKSQNEGVQKKREFKSGTLSKDVAESIMNDLSDREKQLYHQRNKGKKKAGETHENDW